jgi:hypothetical protein
MSLTSLKKTFTLLFSKFVPAQVNLPEAREQDNGQFSFYSILTTGKP